MSQIFLGLFAAAGLPLLVQWGFTESCANEIAGIGLPWLATLPGLFYAGFHRVKLGETNPGLAVNGLGIRK